jgi:complex I intermediate-associated protein 30 (CIA30)
MPVSVPRSLLCAALALGCEARAISLVDPATCDGGGLCTTPSTTDPASCDSSASCGATMPPGDGATVSPADPSAGCVRPSPPIVFDFEYAEPETPAGWYFVSDPTGTRIPADRPYDVQGGGPNQSLFAAHVSGDGYTSWGTTLNLGLFCGGVSQFEGIHFSVRVGGRRTWRTEIGTVEVLEQESGQVCDVCNDAYGYNFELPDERWYECSIRFADLEQQGWGTAVPLNLAHAEFLDFEFQLQDQPFDFWLDNLVFDEVVPETRCVRSAE